MEDDPSDCELWQRRGVRNQKYPTDNLLKEANVFTILD